MSLIRSKPWRGMWVAMLLCAASLPSHAQTNPPAAKEKPPTARVRSVTSPARTSGPLIIDVAIAYRGKKVYRGPVQLTVIRSGNVVAKLDTPEIVVLDGETKQRYVLPTLNRLHESNSTQVSIQMSTDLGTLNLGTHPISAPDSEKRSVVMGLVDPWTGQSGRASRLVSTLSMERFKPSREERGIAAIPARLDPEGLPSDPSALCAFDVLVIPAEGLAKLEDEQLDAVRDWVRAGGAAAVSLGTNLNTKHAKFLNDVISGDGTGHRFIAQPGGTLGVEPEAPASNVGVYDAGFGRLIVAIDALDEGLYDSPAWSHAAMHLWRFRASQFAPLKAGNGWDIKQSKATTLYSYDGEPIVPTAGSFPYYPLTLPAGGTMKPLLMPTTVRVVPFILVVGILAVFALAVGPGDWLLLGLIRQHKLTWIVFPAVAVAFTVGTVFIAEYYMGSRSYKRAVVVEDVDRTGTVLKRSRLQLTFSATQKRIVQEMDGQLLQPMAPSSFVFTSNQYDYQMPSQNIDAGAEEEAANEADVIAGRYPSRYTAAQRIGKWSPRLDRFTQIAPTEGDPPTHIQWGRITTELIKANRLHEILPEDFRGTLALYHRNRNPRLLKGSMSPQNMGYDTGQGDVSGLVNDLCVRPREGMFAIVSQISPTGSDNLEDLSVFDQDDPSQWLIVVLEGKGDDLMMYRYLHREPGDRR